jgi:GNAT superfamily N-acetyltransferase
MNTAADAGLRLREMTADDLEAVSALSRAVRWPHRLEDLAVMLQVGEGAVVEDATGLVGTAMGWRYGEDVGTLGMVIVRADRRRQGLGRQLTEELMRRLGSRSIRLNATEDGLDLYKSLGFVPTATICQHQGSAFTAPMPRLRKGERVRPMALSDGAVVAALDRAATGMDRTKLLDALRGQAQGVILDRSGDASGFALFRRFGHGYVVGPVVAPDQEGARTLITHWLGSQAGKFIRIDVTGDSGLADWLTQLGLEGVDEVVTMVRGRPPERSGQSVTFAIISHSFG